MFSVVESIRRFAGRKGGVQTRCSTKTRRASARSAKRQERTGSDSERTCGGGRALPLEMQRPRSFVIRPEGAGKWGSSPYLSRASTRFGRRRFLRRFRLFLLQEGQDPRSRSSKNAFRKKIPDSVSRIRLMKRAIHCGDGPCHHDPSNSRERNAGRAGRKSTMSRQAGDAPIGAVLSSRLKGQVEGLAFLRTERHFWVLLAQLSCTKARVYSPGGRPLISNLPSGPVTAWNGLLVTLMNILIQGC